MLPLILGRTFAAIRMGIFRWTEPWGFPEEFLADGEKGISSGEMKAWLATNNSTLLPIPPAKGSRHTQFGVVDTHSRAIRGVIHRVDASLVERKVRATAEELFTIVAWAANSSRGRAGVAPVQAAFGMMPRDPLSTQVYDAVTTIQN